MKKALLLFFSFLLLNSMMMAQSFSDDFESYGVGDYLGLSAPEWTTWGNAVGTAEDVRITDENANSGNNSIKFVASPSAGGPQDVVLYYGGEKLTTGFLNTKMSLFIESGAYFNYQAETTIGDTWAMNAFFEANGVGRITSSGDQPILQFSYPENQWFEFEMDINFDANKWQLKVNGVCVGSFASADNSIASIDIYPVAGNSFFVDDFSYEYSETSPEFTEDVRANLDASLDNSIAGNKVEMRGSIFNNGTTVVNSFTGEAMIGGEVISVSEDGLELEKGDMYEFVIDDAFVVETGYNTYTFNVTSVNNGTYVDQDICNDEGAVILFGVEPAEHKKIIVEEATGTWCGFCPRGTVWMDRMQNRYPEHFIGIAVHGGNASEPMLDEDYDTGLGIGAYPNAKVNRGSVIDPSAIENPVLTAVTEPSYAMMEHGALWDENTRELTISLDVTALETLNSGYKVNIALTEDGVTGTTGFYNQANYFSFQTNNADMIGDDGVNWKDLPDPVLAADMVYDHVARAILAPFDGKENSFKEDLGVEEAKTFNFTYTIPAEFDEENMHIISMLINPNGTINTGESTTIIEAVENGFSLATSVSSIELGNATSIYPNPMSEYTTVDINLVKTTDVTIEIMDLSGKSSFLRTYEGVNGFFRRNVDTSNLPVGSYVMKIKTDDYFTSKKISVVR